MGKKLEIAEFETAEIIRKSFGKHLLVDSKWNDIFYLYQDCQWVTY
jgi:hypothetical protein